MIFSGRLCLGPAAGAISGRFHFSHWWRELCVLKHPFHEEMQELTVVVGGESGQPRHSWLQPSVKFAGKLLQLSRSRGSDPPFWCPVLFRVISKFICTAMNRNHLQSREEIFALGNFHFLLVSLFLQCCITTCCCCSVAKSCLTLCDPVDFSVPGFPVLHDLLEFAQMHVH